MKQHNAIARLLVVLLLSTIVVANEPCDEFKAGFLNREKLPVEIKKVQDRKISTFDIKTGAHDTFLDPNIHFLMDDVILMTA